MFRWIPVTDPQELREFYFYLPEDRGKPIEQLQIWLFGWRNFISQRVSERRAGVGDGDE